MMCPRHAIDAMTTFRRRKRVGAPADRFGVFAAASSSKIHFCCGCCCCFYRFQEYYTFIHTSCWEIKLKKPMQIRRTTTARRGKGECTPGRRRGPSGTRSAERGCSPRGPAVASGHAAGSRVHSRAEGADREPRTRFTSRGAGPGWSGRGLPRPSRSSAPAGRAVPLTPPIGRDRRWFGSPAVRGAIPLVSRVSRGPDPWLCVPASRLVCPFGHR